MQATIASFFSPTCRKTGHRIPSIHRFFPESRLYGKNLGSVFTKIQEELSIFQVSRLTLTFF